MRSRRETHDGASARGRTHSSQAGMSSTDPAGSCPAKASSCAAACAPSPPLLNERQVPEQPAGSVEVCSCPEPKQVPQTQDRPRRGLFKRFFGATRQTAAAHRSGAGAHDSTQCQKDVESVTKRLDDSTRWNASREEKILTRQSRLDAAGGGGSVDSTQQLPDDSSEGSYDSGSSWADQAPSTDDISDSDIEEHVLEAMRRLERLESTGIDPRELPTVKALFVRWTIANWEQNLYWPQVQASAVEALPHHSSQEPEEVPLGFIRGPGSCIVKECPDGQHKIVWYTYTCVHAHTHTQTQTHTHTHTHTHAHSLTHKHT